MTMEQRKGSRSAAFLNWLRRHKVVSGLLGIVIIFLLLTVLGVFFAVPGNKYTSPAFDASSVAEEMEYRQAAGKAGFADGDDGANFTSGDANTDIPGVEIQEGSATIDSEDAAADEAVVRSITDSYTGYIEQANQTETNTQLRINLTARVPSADFSDYLEDLRSQLEVEDYNVRNYRIEIEEQTTELDIIADTAAKYAAMKAELNQLPVNVERVNLLMEITEQELSLKRQENHLRQQVDRISRRGDMATLHITLKERRSAEIWPEDLGNDFRDSLQAAIQKVVDIAIAIVTTSLVVFMTVIQWAIYLLISLVILFFIYRLLRRLYKRWNR